MPKQMISATPEPKIIPRTGLTVESDENQLISLAVDAAKKQLVEGTASTSIILHYLKLATPREKLERELLETQKELLVAKREAIESQAKMEDLYTQAMHLMQTYSGKEEAEEFPAGYER